MEERNDGLEAQVERLHVDVADVKAEVRRLDGKIDSVKDSVTALRGEVKDGFITLHDRIAQSERRTVELEGKMTTSITQLTTSVTHLTESVDVVKANVGELRGDYKRLLWAGISACVFVLVTMGTGYVQLAERSDRVHRDLSERSDGIFQELTQRSDRVHQELTQRSDRIHQELSQRSDGIHREMSERYDRLYEKVSELQASMERIASTQGRRESAPAGAPRPRAIPRDPDPAPR